MKASRADQKHERREAMLATASVLFARHGYAATTMTQVAAAAGFGIATVYKYFRSKEGVVCGLLRPDLEKVLAAGDRVLADAPADPARAVLALLSGYGELGGHEWSRRELLRMTIFKGLGNSGELGALIDEAEARVQGQLRQLLAILRRQGRLARGIDLGDASGLIFAIFNQHFGTYSATEDASYQHTQKLLERHIVLLFKNWRVGRRNSES